jgi:hypothetical protein
MDKNLQLQRDQDGPADMGGELNFFGRNGVGEAVRLLVATADWSQVLLAHSTRDRALEALEDLARNAEWTPNEQDGGWAVRLALPRTS